MGGRITRSFAEIGRRLSSGRRRVGTGNDSRNIVIGHDDELDWLLQNINAESVAQRYPLGTRLQVGNRVFRYAKIFPTTVLAPHATIRGRALVTTDAGIERGAFLGAIVADARTITWTTVGGVAADQYKDGYLLTQGGFVHKIKSNTVGLAALAVITLTLYEAFTAGEAIAAGRYGLLLECPYANVGLHTEEGSGRPMGVMQWDPTGDNYVWLQTWGPAAMIATPADMGDFINEIEMTLSSQAPVQEEVSCRESQAALANVGYPTMGQSWVGGGGINWENENFIHIWLSIDP